MREVYLNNSWGQGDYKNDNAIFINREVGE